jgi:hypothetical protein
MERPTIFKLGKPSISMGHLYHGYVSHNQRACSVTDITVKQFFCWLNPMKNHQEKPQRLTTMKNHH